VVAGTDVLPLAVVRAATLAAKDRSTYGALKRGLYAAILPILRGEATGSGARAR
jgi:hypothetical protein